VRQTEGTLQITLITPDHRPENTEHHTSFIRSFVSWVTRGISTHGTTIRSDLQLRVPRSVTVDLKNRFGPVRVAGTQGSLSINCQNGKVELSDIKGAVMARTTFAPLLAEHIGSAVLATQNGNLEVHGVNGSLKATASFGKMRVHDVTGGAD